MRVTLEGTAHDVTDSHGKPTGHIRVRYAVPQVGDGLTAASILLRLEAPDVTVEDVPPARVWTDGDVIVEGQDVWVRRDGRWHRNGGHAVAPDAVAERTLARYPHSVLVVRYQAGEHVG